MIMIMEISKTRGLALNTQKWNTLGRQTSGTGLQDFLSAGEPCTAASVLTYSSPGVTRQRRRELWGTGIAQ